MIIDIFTHMASPVYLEKLSTRGDATVKSRVDSLYETLKGRPLATDVARRIAALDEYGIDRQLVTLFSSLDSNSLGGSPEDQVKTAVEINDSMTRIMQESKGRLLCAGSVPLEALEKGGLREMERAVKALGLKAVAFPSHLRGKPLDSPEFLSFWEKAASLGVPVYIHPANPITPAGRPYENAYDLTHVFGWPFETVLALSRLVFSGIMEKYPTLKVVSHHLGGGMTPFLFGRVEESYPPDFQQKVFGRVFPKPLLEYFRLFYYDTAVGGSIPALKCAIEVFGASQVVFATDSPHGPGGGLKRMETYPKIINSLNIPEADKKKILGENAKTLLNL